MMQSAWWDGVECICACNDGCLATCQGTTEKLARNSGNSMVSHKTNAALMMRDLSDFRALDLCRW